MGNNRRRIELMNALLFSLPGTPIVYYGDEIGMGDNIYLGDRNGVRTPMQWSPDRNAGFSLANPQRLYSPVIIDPEYHYEALNVESQQNNPHSLLWWMKHLIGLRKRYRAFGRGTLRFLSPENPRVLAFVRQWQDERILVVANLSRFAQAAELDLAEFEGTVAGRDVRTHAVPPDRHYAVFHHARASTPSTGSCCRRRRRSSREVTQEWRAPTMALRGGWQELVTGGEQERLEAVLPAYLRRRRWFRGKAREIASVSVSRALPIPVGEREVLLAIVDVSYLDGDAEHYVLPVGHAEGTEAADLLRQAPDTVLTNLPRGEILYDATADETVRQRAGGRDGAAAALAHCRCRAGGFPDPGLRRLWRTRPAICGPVLLRAEQTNSSVNLGDRLLLKFFRKAEPGVNPGPGDRALPHRADRVPADPAARGRARAPLPEPRADHDRRAAPVRRRRGRRLAPGAQRPGAVLRAGPGRLRTPPSEAELAPVGLLDLAVQEPPARIEELTGPFLSQVRLLGQRTAEMHVALASSTEHPAFAPEPFTALYRRSLYQSARSAVRTTFDLLRRRLPTLAEPLQHQARTLIGDGGAAAPPDPRGDRPEAGGHPDPDPRRLPSGAGPLHRGAISSFWTSRASPAAASASAGSSARRSATSPA